MGSSEDVQIGGGDGSEIFPISSAQKQGKKPTDSVLITAEQEWAMWRGSVTTNINQLLKMSAEQTQAIREMTSAATKDRATIRRLSSEACELEEQVEKNTEAISKLRNRASFYIGGGAALLVLINLAVAIWAVLVQYATAGKP